MGVRKIVKAFVASALLALAAVPAASETLADALTDAYENSGLIEQNRAVLRAADEDVAQAMASLRPVVEWSARYQASNNTLSDSTDFSGSISVSASLLLYDFGQSQISIEVQKELVLATRQALVSIEQQVLLRAVSAYMNVRRSTEFVALRQSNVRVITEELRAARDRFEVGEVTQTDVSLAEARLAAARAELAAAQGDLARSVEEFRAAVGRAPGALQPAPAAPVTRSLEDAKQFALRNHPSLLEARHNVAASELNVRRAEAAMNPTVTLDGSVTLSDEFDTSEQIGLTVRGPIYQGGRLSSQLRQAMANRDASRSGLLVQSQSIAQDVGNAFAQLRVSQASRDASDQQIRASRVAFRGVREEATLGARTTLDVLNAEQELLDARASFISAEIDEIIASYTVLSSLGLLTASHLDLPVQSYDPSAYYNLVKDAPTVTSEQGQALDRVLRAIGD